mmetsp:Transcript_51648/g.118653  ORF Transcript_51648/g.118653 Transcript_51648/m.118653 type:complete len:285 (-) Transcript_51648:310-1164(-)
MIDLNSDDEEEPTAQPSGKEEEDEEESTEAANVSADGESKRHDHVGSGEPGSRRSGRAVHACEFFTPSMLPTYTLPSRRASTSSRSFTPFPLERPPKWLCPPAEPDADETPLFLSSQTNTGYEGVYFKRTASQKQNNQFSKRPFHVFAVQDGVPPDPQGKPQRLGAYTTVLEAASRYALFRQGTSVASAVKEESGERTKRRCATEEQAPPLATTESAPAMMEEVTAILTRYGLEQYASELEAFGYDDAEYLLSMGREQLLNLAEVVGMKPGHRAKFVNYMLEQR